MATTYRATDVGPCPACGSSVTQQLQGNEREVRRCRRCRLMYVSPLPSAAQAVELYQTDPVIHFSEGREQTLAVFGRLATRVVGRAGRVLDVGCGAGTFLAYMRRLGWEVHGVDINPRAIAAAKERGIPVVQGTIHDLPALGSFDLLTFMNAIEYAAADPLATINAARRLLNPAGVLAIETPNADFHYFKRKLYAVFRVEEHNLKLGANLTSRLVVFSPRSMYILLQRAGFQWSHIRPGETRVTGGLVANTARHLAYRLARATYRLSVSQLVAAPSMFVFASDAPRSI